MPSNAELNAVTSGFNSPSVSNSTLQELLGELNTKAEKPLVIRAGHPVLLPTSWNQLYGFGLWYFDGSGAYEADKTIIFGVPTPIEGKLVGAVIHCALYTTNPASLPPNDGRAYLHAVTLANTASTVIPAGDVGSDYMVGTQVWGGIYTFSLVRDITLTPYINVAVEVFPPYVSFGGSPVAAYRMYVSTPYLVIDQA